MSDVRCSNDSTDLNWVWINKDSILPRDWHLSINSALLFRYSQLAIQSCPYHRALFTRDILKNENVESNPTATVDSRSSWPRFRTKPPNLPFFSANYWPTAHSCVTFAEWMMQSYEWFSQPHARAITTTSMKPISTSRSAVVRPREWWYGSNCFIIFLIAN
jgi:hypothetical protein